VIFTLQKNLGLNVDANKLTDQWFYKKN